MANTHILNIIINKYDYRQKFSLIVLFEINKKSLEIRFYKDILLFYLAVGLKIKSN